jgi:drug/metabolite transporter (DMT)-like permease
LLIGVVGGIAFVTTYCILASFMNLRGLPVAATVTQLSVLVPIGFALLIWGEKVGMLQTAGGGLALLALPFLSFRSRRNADTKKRDASIALLFLLFMLNGLAMLSVRWYYQAGIVGEESVFFFLLFSVSALLAWVVWFAGPRRIGCRDLLPGVVLGICNSAANRLIMSSLETLPSIVVYPSLSAGSLVFTILFALLIWKERITRLEMIGVALTFAAILLINLNR